MYSVNEQDNTHNLPVWSDEKSKKIRIKTMSICKTVYKAQVSEKQFVDHFILKHLRLA